MKQSRLATLFETLGGTALGYLIALGVQHGVNWFYGLQLTNGASAQIVAIFTVASLLRGFAWRRFCEWLNVRRKLSPGMQAVIAERFRQIEVEGYDAAHDNAAVQGELGAAGAAYLLTPYMIYGDGPPSFFPWEREFWNPKDMRRDLVRGCALGLAELDRFDRIGRKKMIARPGR